ncbi:MAG: DUF4147 domain-containing protein [Phycisphaerales bacterium]|nr:DUF4147 domain-containing protein [Phycisphaerales bacterium]
MARTPRETLLGGIVPEILRAADPAGLVSGVLGGGAPIGRCRAVAVGKAAAPMIGAAAGALGEQLEGAVVVAPPGGGHGPARAGLGRPGVEWLGADHPTPTPRNLAAAGRVRELVAGMGPGQTLLVLLSGGASAMLCLPREPLTLGDLASVTDALLRAGAPIGELNAVRKHCEVLKGGGLAAVRGAGGEGRIVSLILSDVLGDRLDVIGSGPTAPDPTTFADALGVLERRGALDASPAATDLLRRGAAGAEPETVKPGAPVWARVENRVIGSNRLALDAAAAACDAAGYAVLARREGVEGEAAVIGRELAAEARRLAAETGRRGAIVWGGETTVTVGDAPGLGGRNQELALACAIELDGVDGVTVLSFATDGRDGPTDAAGGVVDGSTAGAIRGAGIEPRDALARHDSYHALNRAGALVRTGPTGTNINDLMVALVG